MKAYFYYTFFSFFFRESVEREGFAKIQYCNVTQVLRVPLSMYDVEDSLLYFSIAPCLCKMASRPKSINACMRACIRKHNVQNLGYLEGLADFFHYVPQPCRTQQILGTLNQ